MKPPSEPEPALDEAAVAAATIMKLEEEDAAATSVLTTPESDPTLPLHRVAEEILSGVKRQVEVQYLVHDDPSDGKATYTTDPLHSDKKHVVYTRNTQVYVDI